MKNKYLYIFFIGMMLLSCKKDNNYVFDKSPDERITEKLANYDATLSGNTSGWLLSLDTDVAGGFNHWVKFDGNNRAFMLSDADGTTAKMGETSKNVKESGYRLKSVQTPILMFDTYTYIHMLADPESNVNGGTSGYGLKTDFEFVLGEYEEHAGRLPLTGRYNKSKAYLVKCTAAQYQAIQAGGLKKLHTDFKAFIENTYKFPVLDFGTKKVDLSISSRQLALKYINSADELETQSTSVYLDMAGLAGTQPVSNLFMFDSLSYEGNSFNQLLYEEGKFYTLVSQKKVYVTENHKPALPFRFGYKKDFSQMRIDVSKLSGTLLDPFLSQVYLEAKNRLFGNGQRNMQYGNIAFTYDATKGKPIMVFTIRYNNTAGSAYTATWNFQYTQNEDGTITFTDRDQSGSSNERGQEPFLKAFVDYFCTFEYSSYSTSADWSVNKKKVTKITPRTFKFDWVENNTPGLAASVGGVIPVNASDLQLFGICCGTVSK